MLSAPGVVGGIAVEGGQLGLALLRNNRAAKAALDGAGLFRPVLNSAGKIQPKSWLTSRFMTANAWRAGATSQFAFGFATAQLDPGQAPAPESLSGAFRAGHVAGTIYSFVRQFSPW